MTERECPSDATLRAFDAGDLAGTDLERVAEHLEGCPACERRLDAGQSTNAVVDALRRPRSRPPVLPGVNASGANATAQVAGYEILELLGRGGMGVVHKARDRRLNRLVALKRIRLGGRADRELFRREAEAVAQLQHPNIVQIFEIGELDGEPYLALEYVPGGSLAQHLDGKPLAYREAAELVETLARAVQHAHEREVVHRDLKPANILLAFSREPPVSVEVALAGGSRLNEAIPKIADFGVAKRLDSAASATAEGVTVGTPQYMAPEQAAGKSRTVGPAADVYALGAVLYELLTGRPPFVGESSLETLRQVLEQEPLPPHRLRPRLPRDLETICLKCLHKVPARRYASAAELADDLARWQRHEPIRARPVGPGERLRRRCQRKPALAALAAALVLVTALGLAGIFWQWGQAVAARDVAEDARIRADEERAKAQQLAGELRTQNEQILRQTYRSNILAAAGALEMSNVAGARALLAAAPTDFRNWEWRHYTSQLDGARSVLRGCPTTLWGKPLSPDGRRLALLERDGTLHLFDAPTGAAIRLESGRDQTRYRYVIFTPNSRWIVARAQDETLHVRDGQTGKLLTVLHPAGEKGPTYYVLSPDSRYVAAIRDDQKLRLWELPSFHDCTPPSFASGGEVHHLAFSADGRRLAYSRKDGTVRVAETTTGQELAVLRGHRATITILAFSPDGAFLATGGAYPDNHVHLWRADTGILVADLRGHKNLISSLVFSPDGARLASVSADQTGRLWDGRTGRLIAILHGHAGPVGVLAFSRDGHNLVSASDDGSLRLWDPETGALVGVLHGHTDAIFNGTFGDGGLLASTSADGTTRLWDVREAGRGLLRGHESYVYDVAFSPDGTRLASAGWDGQVRLWNMADGRSLTALSHGADILLALAYSPDGQRLAVAEDRARGIQLENPRLDVWDLETGQRQFAVDVPSVIRSVAWGRRGATIAAGTDDGRVYRWDAQTGAPAEPLSGHTGAVLSTAFRPGGDQLASGGNDRTVRLWDAATGAALAVLPGHPGPVYRLAWSADGRLLAAASEKTVHLWDVPTGALVAVLGHASNVYGVAFSPDGTRLAAGCRDNTIRLWDVATREEVAELRGHTDYVHSVAFSPDGTRLASASGDFTVRVWDTLSAQERLMQRSDAWGPKPVRKE